VIKALFVDDLVNIQQNMENKLLCLSQKCALMLNQEVCFEMLLSFTKKHKVMLVVDLVKNDRPTKNGF